MAQPIKNLLSKNEDLSSILRTYKERWCMFVIQCWVWGDRKTTKPHLPSSLSLIGDLQAMRDSVSQEVDSILRMTPKTALASAYLHTYMNMNPTCMNMHI